ncbi:hypothetical protein [Providencia hangzhouensis]
MAKLTKKESAWVNKLQKVIDECPSERIGYYVTGADNTVMIFDRTLYPEINRLLDKHNWDFCLATHACDADFELRLEFPCSVESTAG